MLDLSLKVNGYPIERARSVLRAIQHQGELERSGHLNRRRQSIVNYHRENNRFYQQLLGDKTLGSWDDVPVITKADLRLPLGKRLSKGFGRHNVHVHKTSGSSGHPLIFAKDRFCHAMAWAVNQNRFSWYGIDQNKDLQARFYGIPLDWKGYQKERLKDRLSSRYRFPIFDLSDQKMGEFVKEFSKRPFVYINGYTSSIVLFAKFLKKKGVVLTSVCPTLKYCIVTSEMLFENDKKLLENQLGVPVLNEYGASELDLIAFTNTHGNFQLNSETLFVEVVDANGKKVANGTLGRIVITSLYNKAQAMIRYDIGDMGVIDPLSTPKNTLMRKSVV